jgi:hypothetical protein
MTLTKARCFATEPEHYFNTGWHASAEPTIAAYTIAVNINTLIFVLMDFHLMLKMSDQFMLV